MHNTSQAISLKSCSSEYLKYTPSDIGPNTPSHHEQLIREHEAAFFMGHSVNTLRKWRVIGGGPKFIKISRRSVRYRRCDLIFWANSRLVSSTSEVVR
jgi:predicted DNA-binding transcriptional regulator AlpA